MKAGTTNRAYIGTSIYATGDFTLYMYASPTGARFYVTPAGLVGIGQAFYAPLTRLHVMETTTITNAVKDTLRIETRVSTAATGGAAGFGAGLSFFAEDATDTTYQQQVLIASSWVDATNATRKAKLSLSAYDTAVRLGLEIEASGSAAMLGFFGHATAVQPSAYTITNDSADRALDCNSTSLDELADVVGTLVKDLQSLGLVG
jgi:hypothetical protein